jgi:hypothetical protein
MASEAPWDVKQLGEIADDWKQIWKPQDSRSETVDHYSIPAFDKGRMPTHDRPGDIKSNKRVVAPDAVLLSRLNPITPRVWTPSIDPERESVCSTEMLVLRPRSGVDRDYLHYLCRSPHVSLALLERVSGTTGSHQRVSPSDVLSLPVPVPSIAEQKAIAEVLVALDDRIDWCASLGERLYELQDALFTDLTRAPTMQCRPLGEFVSLDKGVSYKGAALTDDRSHPPLINLGVFGLGRAPRWEKLKWYDGKTKPRHHVAFGDVVVCATDMTHDRIVLGKALLVPQGLDGAAISHHLYAVRIQPDAPVSAWLIALMLNHELTRRVVASFANGTTVLSLPRDALARVQVPLVEPQRLAEFDRSVSDLQTRIDAANDEEESLREARDQLLPRLFSRQLVVERPARVLAPVA